MNPVLCRCYFSYLAFIQQKFSRKNSERLVFNKKILIKVHNHHYLCGCWAVFVLFLLGGYFWVFERWNAEYRSGLAG